MINTVLLRQKNSGNCSKPAAKRRALHDNERVFSFQCSEGEELACSLKTEKVFAPDDERVFSFQCSERDRFFFLTEN